MIFTIENDKYNHIKLQLRLLFTKLYNETDLDLFTHIYLYGNKSRSMLVDKKIFKSKASVRNYICKWRKLDVITKDKTGELTLNPMIKLYDVTTTYTINLVHKNE